MDKRHARTRNSSAQPVILDVLPAGFAPRLDTSRQRRKFLLKRLTSKTRWPWLAVALVILSGSAVLLIRTTHHSSLVPAAVQHSVSFSVFYPDPARLPKGYTLDMSSFRASNQVVLYVVNSTTKKHVVFTVQQKPSDDDLSTFYRNQLPLRSEFSTPIGKASVGVLNKQTFASIPTNTSAWVLVTAPLDIKPDDFSQIITALRAP